VADNVRIKDVCVAPNGKEVEELNGKEILMCLRKRVSAQDFLSGAASESKETVLDDSVKDDFKLIFEKNKGSGKAILLDDSLGELSIVSTRSLASSLKKSSGVSAVIVDGAVTAPSLKAADEAGVRVIVASSFAKTDTEIQLLSY